MTMSSPQLNLRRKIAPINTVPSPPAKKQAIRVPDKVLIVGSQTGEFCVFTEKGRSPNESSFIQPAIDLLTANNELKSNLHINGIYTRADPTNPNTPLRYVTKKGSGPFDWQVFVRILNDPLHNTYTNRMQYGELITKWLNMVSEKHYTYKISFVFAGDLTPKTGPLPLGQLITTPHVMDTIINSQVDDNLTIDKILDDDNLLVQYFGERCVTLVRSYYPHYTLARPYLGVAHDVTSENTGNEEEKLDFKDDSDFHTLFDSSQDFESHHPE